MITTMYTVGFETLIRLAPGSEKLPLDAMSGNPPASVSYHDALRLADFQDVDRSLSAMSQDGVLDWDRFDISPFARLMPSMAVLDRLVRDDGLPDFRYGFVGENICAIAKRNLRGVCLRDVLVGESRDRILAEYEATVDGTVPRASTGNVTISDLHWVRYLRFLYPVRTETGIDRVLLFMLFAAPSA